MAVRSYQAVLADIGRRPSTCGLRLVSVDGGSGSGKSTLAARLAEQAGAPLIAGDDFLSWPDLHGWWPRFQQQVVEPLRRGENVWYQVRDWVGDEFGTSLRGWKTLDWAPLVFVEGVTVGRRCAGDAFAYRIWVTAPAHTRLRRGVARDGESHRTLWLEWMARERDFFALDGTAEAVDLSVDGAPTEPHDPKTELVLSDCPVATGAGTSLGLDEGLTTQPTDHP